MFPITIALIQLLPEATLEQNLQKGLTACHKAKELGADIVLFPEMWSVGYEQKYMDDTHAVELTSDFIQQFQQKANELELAIAITYLGKSTAGLTNSVALINAQGKIILDYAKVHLCDFEDGTDIGLEPGDSFKVADLKIRNQTIKIGAMICFDREFPEAAHTLMLKGAELILVPNSCRLVSCPVLGDVRFAQLRSRAFENMAGIALANYPAPRNDGHSCAINPDGKPIFVASTEEGVFTAQFDLHYITDWRAIEVWG